jgi:hypothetical protein
MIVAKNLETRKFVEFLKRREQEDKERRRRAKKEGMLRLAAVQYHRDGSVTKIWRND